MSAKLKLLPILRFAVMFGFLTSVLTLALPAQDPPKVGQDTKKSSKKKDDQELPELETLTLQTKDGVQLNVQFLASTKGKNAPAIILIHDWEHSSKDFMAEDGIAYDFQKKGFAVIAPDLRGHGKSLSVVNDDKEIDLKKFKKADFASMMEDLETCKRYLLEQNNEGKLNIELLSILACGKTSVLAMEWAIQDWRWPPHKGVKQGQDVKSLILLSPEKSWKGLSITKSMKASVISGKDGKALPLFVLTGDANDSLKRQTKEIENTLKRTRGEDLAEDSLTVIVGRRTKIQGAEFTESAKARQRIQQFIELRVLSQKADLRWQNRAKAD